MPAVPKAKVKSRIILTPEHAKRLLMSLQENIVRYESVHGQIVIPTPQHTGDQLGGKIGRSLTFSLSSLSSYGVVRCWGPHSLRTGACVVSHCCPQRPPKRGADASLWETWAGTNEMRCDGRSRRTAYSRSGGMRSGAEPYAFGLAGFVHLDLEIR